MELYDQTEAPDAHVAVIVGSVLSIEALIIEELHQFRSMDRQVYTFRVGNYYFTGPVPDARTEGRLIDLALTYDANKNGAD